MQVEYLSRKKYFRQVVQYVLDHWSDFRSWRVNVCGESENAIPDSFHSGNQYSLQRLQVEVDQFFLRAAQQIISAHRYVHLSKIPSRHPDCFEMIWQEYSVTGYSSANSKIKNYVQFCTLNHYSLTFITGQSNCNISVCFG